MQVSTTLSAQLGLGSKLVDWYWDATTAPYVHFLIVLSPRNIDRLRFCTNTASIHSKFHVPDRLQQRKFEKMISENLSTLQLFQSFSRKCKSLFLHSCPKQFIRFLCDCIVNLLNGNLQSIKRHQVTKCQTQFDCFFYKNHLEAKKGGSVIQKMLLFLKIHFLLVINHLFCYGAVCFRPCFSV